MNMKVRLPNRFAVPPIRLAITTLILVAVAIAAVFIWQAVKSSTSEVPAPDYWPTAGWRSTIPEAQGVDSDKLADLLLAVREKNVQIHSLLVIRNGYVVADATFYPYDGRTVHNVASVTKSLMTTLIGIAADQGKLDLDDTMVSFFPDRSIANLDPRKEDITVRHLASMSSGLDCTNEADELTLKKMVASPNYVQFVLDREVAWEPGKQFLYCSPAIHLLSPILQQATGISTLDFARQNLFEPLGFGDVMWPRDPQGYYAGWADVSLHPHDMAKLGFLFLHKGQWDGKQIVSRRWVEEATRAQVATPAGDVDPYGYGWWMVPDIEGVYRADGRGGQYIFVLPQWNMIVVTTGGGFEMDEIGEQILASISDFEEPLPANPAGVARLEAAIDVVMEPPELTPVNSLPDLAQLISGKPYIFDPNPAELQSAGLVFDGLSEASAFIEFSGHPQVSVPVGLDGVFRFSPGPDGRPQAYRGAWTDPQTFMLEYDGITNNDHAFLQFRYEGDRVDVSLQETAHDVGAQLVGWQQQP
jgi:CubicO group peptidase (beta-lactamase class C family)